MSNSVLTRQQITAMATRWINEIDTKRIETGYANAQPDWPYWVQPMNYVLLSGQTWTHGFVPHLVMPTGATKVVGSAAVESIGSAKQRIALGSY